jgi:hypothetical protein
MRLAYDSPSFTPVYPQIRAIGPRDLHHAKGRGRDFAKNLRNGTLRLSKNESPAPKASQA